jgi:hypothetical protein
MGDNVSLTFEGVTISHNGDLLSFLSNNINATIYLTSGNLSTLQAGGTANRGILFTANSNLTITGSGSLTVESEHNQATMGGGAVNAPQGNLIINGGNVTVNNTGGGVAFNMQSVAVGAGGTLNTNPRPTVTFDLNGGNIGGNTTNPTAPADQNGNRLASLPTPTRGTYTLVGWFTAQTGGAQITAGANGTVFTNNATVYAQWEAQVPIPGQVTEPPQEDMATIEHHFPAAQNVQHDVPHDVPQTGVTGRMLVTLFLGIAGVFVVAGAQIFRRNKKKNR